MSQNTRVRSRIEVGDQTIHRVQSSGQNFDSASVHFDGTLRCLRAEMLFSGPIAGGLYLAARHVRVDTDGIRISSVNRIERMNPHTMPKTTDASWSSYTALGGSMVAVGTLEIHRPERDDQWYGRIHAANETQRCSLSLVFKDFDVDAGFDVALATPGHDVFVMSSSFLREKP